MFLKFQTQEENINEKTFIFFFIFQFSIFFHFFDFLFLHHCSFLLIIHIVIYLINLFHYFPRDSSVAYSVVSISYYLFFYICSANHQSYTVKRTNRTTLNEYVKSLLSSQTSQTSQFPFSRIKYTISSWFMFHFLCYYFN